MLCGSGRENACRTCTVNKYLLGGTLATARSQHKRFCRKYRNAASADGMHRKASVAVFVYFRDKRQGAVFDIAFVQLIFKPLGVFRTGELLAEVMKTETVVNALLEYSSEPCLSFKKENLGTVIMSAYRRRKSGRAAADNEYVIVTCRHHSSPPSFTFVSPYVITASAEDFLTSYSGTPRNSAIILVTSGEQKPP